MHIPEYFAETNVDVLHHLIDAHPLGTWVVSVNGNLVVNHLPFVLHANRGEYGTLTAHVARANDVWKFAANSETNSDSSSEPVAVFQGPESYITPSWYPSKHEHGKAVPTWNYAVVHAYGVPRIIEDAGWLRQHVAELTQQHEAMRDKPWDVSDAPNAYIDALLSAIVGIEIPITRLVGKWKVSQNRPARDRSGVIAGLQASADDAAQQMAKLVEQKGK